MGLPATAADGALRRIDHRRVRRPDDRRDGPCLAGARNQPSPTYYLPRACFANGVLREADGSSWCEWKGRATYFDLVTPSVVAPRAAWTYLTPTRGFTEIAGALAVMPTAVDRCTVNGEVVVPQPGGFYGGWITSWVAGPFKGVPGSMGW